MRNRSLSAILACAVLALLTFAVGASGASTAAGSTQLYIVQMKLDPVAAYEGGVAGIPATKPAKGKKIDRKSEAVQRYVGHLKTTHDQALSKVGASKVYDYFFTFNGVAAELTEAQVAALKKQDAVTAVFENEIVSVDTSSTPAFLGLDDKKGIWRELGGPKAKANGKKDGAGENIIIGVVDSGIWPESLSFTDQKIKRDKLGKVIYEQVEIGTPPDGWAGSCQTGEEFAASDCNNKLIGARYFNAAFGGDAGINATRPWEFNSPRDYHGHGTHTASTAGGNHGVPATGAAAAFGKTSGIAPRARIAAYKALWSAQDGSTASGATADLAAAIDTAVADGVDVINYSVSGATTNFLDPVQIAFLNAANAGVFVAASAGNAGTAGSVAHPSPWLTTVAAETHDRLGKGALTIDGTTYNGASPGTGSATGQLVMFGAPGTAQRRCFLNALPPGAAVGKIVFCERGTNARVEKSFEVARVGGIGMVLVNPSFNTLNADLHFVPTVHLADTDYTGIENAATAGKTAAISGEVLYGQPAPFIAGFSSRGPSAAAGGDILKPDLGAPGNDVLASVAPPANRGRDFDLYSGTSMSAPHVAGIAALFKQLHPDWSPMAIKSALMTTGSDILDAFTATAASEPSALKTFSQGAGHVQPNAAMDPGLVYDSDIRDWLAFLCGTTTAVVPSTCSALTTMGYSTQAADMNTPSVQLGNMAGTRTVTRRVTNVGDKRATYTATSSFDGVLVAVSPSTLTLEPGETKAFQMTFTTNGAALDRWTAGSLTWSDGKRNVRIPLVVRPRTFASPAEVTSTGSPVSWKVNVGYNGPLSAGVGGLVAATQTPWTVAQDPDQTFSQPDPTGTFEYATTVAAGAVFRAGIYEDAILPTGTDLDLFVYRCPTPATCSAVGSSADGDSNEEVTTVNTAATPVQYRVYVHGWDTGGPSASGTLFTWAVGTTDAGNTTISGVTSPASVGQQTHTATFSGLAGGTRYLGRVDYSNGSTAIGRTLVSVRTP